MPGQVGRPELPRDLTGNGDENMDFNEFKERSGADVTEEEYAKIEAVYLVHPKIADVGEMILWYERYGMDGVDAAYDLAVKLSARTKQCNELTNEHNHDILTIDDLREQVAALGQFIPKQVLAGQLIAKLTTEQIAVMLTKRD